MDFCFVIQTGYVMILNLGRNNYGKWRKETGSRETNP